MKNLSSSLSCRTTRHNKLKLLVSFNGAFSRRPPSAKFRYTGGETRLISVDPAISFSKLTSKIADLIRPHGGPAQFYLKYLLSESSTCVGGPGSSGAADHHHGEAETTQPLLILLESDDDVRCMVEEYEIAEYRSESLTRLWIFVCHDTSDNFGRDNDVFVNKRVLRVEGDGFCVGKKGFAGNVREDEGFTSIEENLVPQSIGRVRNVNRSNASSNKKFNDNYSLRKIVLRQQLLSKKLDGIPISPHCGFEQSEMVLGSEASSVESCPESDSPLTSVSNNIVNFGGGLSRKMTDYKYVNAHKMTNDNFSKVLRRLTSNDWPSGQRSDVGFLGQSINIFGNEINYSNLEDTWRSCYAAGLPSIPSYSCGAKVGVDNSVADLNFGSVIRATLNDMNKESIVQSGGGNQNMENNGFLPLVGHHLLTGGAYPARPSPAHERGPEGYQGGNRNHRFGSSVPRSQRNCPYHIRSRNVVTGMGKNCNHLLDGKPWAEKFYPRLRFSSSISNPGDSLRVYGDSSSDIFSNSRCHTVEQEEGRVNFGRNNSSKMFSLPSSWLQYNIQRGLRRVLKHERVSPAEGARSRPNSKFSLPIDTVASSTALPREVKNQINLLVDPCTEKLDTVSQALRATDPDEMEMNAEARFDVNWRVHLWNQEEVVISDLPHNLSCSSEKELNCHDLLLDTEPGRGSNIYQRCVHASDGQSASSVDFSLHNLSLVSTRELQPPSASPADVDKSESLLELQSEALDLMEEERLNSGPVVENSSDAASNSPPIDATRFRSHDKTKQEIQQDTAISLCIEDNDENENSNKSLKFDGNCPADIASFYTHLATRELQNINNSDIECIKELGSGTFGTVYYGKWKGSDVAIKRIRPSCFTDGAKKEDRLVADFWKEAHILGQLHHPNIVAFYGIVTDGPLNTFATVTEYMVNGSLRRVLRRKDRTIDRRKRLIIAMDAAFGMEYLHGKKIVHFDLKSHNFLMNTRDPQRPICKIGDLGLSKIKQRTLVSGGVRGTIPWMAPELLSGKNLVSEKVDVYSFAIVMWELLSGEEPYADMRSEEIIGGIIRGNLRPEIPSWCDPAWRSLMERCWSSDPDCRPTFREVAKELRAMAAAMNIK